jgi:hypothetical protein
MKKDRGVLEGVLHELFDEYCANKEVENKLKKDLAKHGITTGTVVGILNRTIPIETQSQVVLYLVTKSLFNATEESRINPENYFTEIEIEEANKFKREFESQKDYVDIEDIRQVDEDQWITTMTYKQISDLYATGKVRYNKETQRNTIFKEYGDKIIESININKTSVKEIKELMLQGLFIPNTITFNILATGKEKFEIDNRNKSIRIYDNLDIIDGFHRSLGGIEAVAENPEIEGTLEVRITNFNLDKCHRFIVQEDKKNKIDKRYIQTLNVENLENKVVKLINENTGEMQGKVTSNIILYRNQAYVLSDVLSDAIKSNFNIESNRDVNNVAEYLIKGFDEIVGIFINDFKNLEESRKNNIRTLSSTFIGYVTLLAELQDNENWKKELEKILNKINFNNTNLIWKELGIYDSSPSKSSVKKIIKYFKELI